MNTPSTVPPGERGVRAHPTPAVSIVLTSHCPAEELSALLSVLVPVVVERDIELVIVRTGPTAETDRLGREHPTVLFVSAPPATPLRDLRAGGAAVAEGDIVRIVEDERLLTVEWVSGAIPIRRSGDNGRSQPERIPSRVRAPSRHGYAPLHSGDRVVVVGGGPAGLTAAHLLAKDGIQVTLLEADGVLGGISQTAQYKGYRFDIGGHRFFTKYTPVQELWDEILGDEFISVPRMSRIYYDGKFFDYPLRAVNALRSLGIWNAILIVLSFLKAHFRPSPVEENFEQWVSNRFGKRLYEIFFKTYTEKVWGIPCTEIRAEWAAQRIQGLSLVRAVLSATSLNRRSPTIKTLIDEFRYPRLGPGQMWELCAKKVVEHGGNVLLHHRVTAIEVEGETVRAVRAVTPDGERRFECEHCISTMPLRQLTESFDPPPPKVARQAGVGLRYRDFLVVALILDRPDLFPDNWIYVHSPDVKVGRVQNFGNWSRDLVPEEGRSCLGLEYFCFEGDGLWTTPDEDLVELATRELDELGLAAGAHVLDGTVVRMPKAYPIYDAEYTDHLTELRRFIDPISNLHPVGRNGMHKYNNQDHSMLTAMMTVWNMSGAEHDVWSVNTDFEYHEEQRLEEPVDADHPPSLPSEVSR